ncbi:FtsX-like permease family protein [Exilibacterium tricleocarpae]|uniref:FtsX-like permease family protein n=1 Tax=Exilibacterium tricleocarpae TaxID=2591008 RepID=A0A545TN95_9GAMM|nr:FtsX-like permease family protein [Exilibacterium tricleocarpae]TQV78699.1 FtsX-like permease family protein [Exilibacterium tricleocarpae]
MLALRLLWRNWRSGEVKILAGALLLAVAVVSAIGVFTERLERSLIKESSSFLGADRIVRSSHPIDPDWFAAADEQQVRRAQSILFSSMVFSGDNMHLASVKAVTPGYPLAGTLEISRVPFAVDAADVFVAPGVPAPGEAWVDSRLLPLLDVGIGDTVEVGEKTLTVSHVVIREPDRGDGFSLFGARLMMNAADLDATDVIQPGSRVRYHWLLAGDETRLEGFIRWLEPRLTEHQRIVDLDSAQRGLSTTLNTGRRFLMLAGVVGVLLAGVAIAIAAQRFAGRHVDQVALMKSLGASAWRIRRLYAGQLLLLAIIASLAGLLVGDMVQRLVASALAAVFPVSLGAAPLSAYGVGAITGLVCALFFALPPLWHLPVVPPLKILRREMEVGAVRAWSQGALGLCAVVLLVWLYSGDTRLTAAVVLGLGAVICLAALAAWRLVHAGRYVGMRAGSIWRLALANLQRRRGQSVVQILVFAIALMLLLTLATVRTSLIDEWQVQLPADTPNHFLVNVAPHEVEPIQQLMAAEGVSASFLFPMVRGRLTHINDALPTAQVQREAEVLRREANLSWTETLNPDNKITAGQWWPQWSAERGVGVSVEQEIAERLQLELGDRLRFSIGGLRLDATVASFRSLEWDSMRPNFYFLFSPGALDNYSPMYLTSVYLPPRKKLFVNDLLREFPTVVVVEMDKVIEQIRVIVAQVSRGVELVLWLVLAGGLFVLLAAVNASMDSRLQESGLLRALGSRRGLIMGSLWAEFSALGFFAGVLAVLGAEVLLFGLQTWVLNIPIQPHLLLWVLGPFGGAALVGALGVLSCQRVVTVAPAVVLREVG